MTDCVRMTEKEFRALKHSRGICECFTVYLGYGYYYVRRCDGTAGPVRR
jgi:hypothetical protein